LIQKNQSLLVLFLIYIFTNPVFGQELFRSNISGIPLGRIQSPLAEGFYLEVTGSESGEFRNLFRDGELIKSIEIIRSGTRRIEIERGSNGRIQRQDIYLNGQISEQEYFDESGFLYKDRFLYTNSRLNAVERLDENGSLLFKDYYIYALDGTLHKFFRLDGARFLIVRTEIFSSGNLIFQYQDLGALKSLTINKDGTSTQRLFRENTLESETVSINENGLTKISSETEFGTVTQYFDPQGSLLSQEGPGDRYLENSYDSEKKLIERIIRDGNSLERILYEYDQEGELILERLFRNRTLVKEVEYISAGNRREIFYRRGTAFYEVLYENDEEISRKELDDTDEERSTP
jgi:antitoxin component YwqK of YwqJK toxin-antitoxin module